MNRSYHLDALLQLALEAMAPLGVEKLPLAQALGRTLAADAAALRDEPPLPLSPIDGYALRTADLDGARRNRPVELTLSREMGPGLAVPVRAGDVLPQGCDAVVPLSDTNNCSPTLSVYRELWPYDNFIRQGAHFRAGELLLSAGTVLLPGELCLLSATGHSCAPVRALPSACILSASGAAPTGALYLDGLLRRWGTESAGPDEARLLLLLGPHALPEGARLLCPPIERSPMGLSALAERNGQLILFLSEDPVELLLAASLLIRPILAALTGREDLELRRVGAALATPFPKASPAGRLLTGRYEDGCVALPALSPLRALAQVNCIVELAPGTPALGAGAEVSVVLL